MPESRSENGATLRAQRTGSHHRQTVPLDLHSAGFPVKCIRRILSRTLRISSEEKIIPVCGVCTTCLHRPSLGANVLTATTVGNGTTARLETSLMPQRRSKTDCTSFATPTEILNATRDSMICPSGSSCRISPHRSFMKADAIVSAGVTGTFRCLTLARRSPRCRS